MFEKIVNLSDSEIGSTEENVKNNVVIPLLEALGHRGQLDFERSTRSGKIDIFIKNLPPDCSVIFEVKNLGVELVSFIPQLETYCRETGALLGVLTNGDDILIFDPFWRGRTLSRQLIFAIKRKKLVENVDVLKGILSREALTTKSVISVLENREKEIGDAEREIEEKQKEYDDIIQALQVEIDEKEAELEARKGERDSKVKEVYVRLGLPSPRTIEGPPSRPSLFPAKAGTQKDIIRKFIMGSATIKRCVTTDEIFEYVRKLPEFQRYRDDDNKRKNAVWKANELTKEDPQHFSHPDRNTYCYNP